MLIVFTLRCNISEISPTVFPCAIIHITWYSRSERASWSGRLSSNEQSSIASFSASVALTYDDTRADFAGAALHPALPANVFFRACEPRPGAIRADLAALGDGVTFHGTGELAIFRFRGKDPALSFAERFGLLVERQWSAREEGRLARRLKAAQLKVCASIEEVDFRSPRGLERSTFLELAELSFLRAAGNVIITGATGLGKTFLACALADRVLHRGHTALYRRLPKLLFELALARADGTYLKSLEKLAKV